jgi:hypothetical protein
MSQPQLSSTSAYEINVLSDGTTTVAEVNVKFSPFSSLHVLGEGVARRRKGDVRNRDVGELLALARAFSDAYGNCIAELEARGFDGLS